MSATFNGIGTMPIAAGNDVGLGSDDAILCFVIGGLPLVPLKPMHVVQWNQRGYLSFPIPWSWALLARVMLRGWSLGLMILGAITAVMAGGLWSFRVVSKNAPPQEVELVLRIYLIIALSGLGAAAVGLLGYLLQASIGGRTRDVRRVMGRHDLGTSDPTDWPASVRNAIRPAQEWLGKPTYGETVPWLLEQRRFSEAMLAARLCSAREDANEGSKWTATVLAHPEVQVGPQRVRKQPEVWKEVFGRAS